MRSRDVAPPLASIFERSARGELPQIAWDQELKSVASELPPTDRASFAATRELRKALLRRIPHDSHELRLREALRSVAEGAPDEHAVLSIVMEGAIACGAQSLQAELLERFRRLARRNRVEDVHYAEIREGAEAGKRVLGSMGAHRICRTTP